MDLLEQLEDRFLVGDGCWEWTGQVNHKGYGVLYQRPGYRPRNRKAHRVVYELLVGPIPTGKQLDHQCHNQDKSCPGGVTCRHRRCVNPGHLEPVTPKINTGRGRGPSNKRIGGDR